MYSDLCFFFFFSSRRRHTRSLCDWSSDVCSSDLELDQPALLDGEPGDARTNGIRDRRRQLGGSGGAGRKQLGDVERVAARGGVEIGGSVAGERGDRRR